MSATTTPTGVPIIECGQCHGRHPETRRHCSGCGAPSVFLSPETGECLRCGGAR